MSSNLPAPQDPGISGPSKWPKRKIPLVLAWTATGTAGLFGAWKGIVGLFGGAAAVFNPIVALTSLTVIGLVWYTYFTQQTLEHTRATYERTDDRRRGSIATAVLAELYGLTARLQNLSKYGPSAGTPAFLSHPMLELAASDPAVFRHETIQAITALLRRLKDVQEYMDRYPALERSSKDEHLPDADRKKAEDERATTYLGIKTRSSWAYNRAVCLTELLHAEGGAMPTGPGEQSVALFESVSLLADPFDRAEDA